MWADLTQQEQDEVRVPWCKAVNTLIAAKVAGAMWSLVRSPMSVVIVVLLEQGWWPVLPGKWRSPCRKMVADIGGGRFASSAGQIVRYVDTLAKQVVWRQVSAHYGGGGLEQGIPAFDAAAVARKLLPLPGLGEQAVFLNAVVVGGFTLGAPWAVESARVCDRCTLGALDDLAHRYFECPCICQVPTHTGG